MAKHDSTELFAVRAIVDHSIVDPSLTSPELKQCLFSRDTAVRPVVGLMQVESLRIAFSRRVMAAIATIPSVEWHREALVSGHGRLGAALLAKFDAAGVEDIPSDQFAAARQFLESFELDFGAKAQLRC
jgi:hypothetical protein